MSLCKKPHTPPLAAFAAEDDRITAACKREDQNGFGILVRRELLITTTEFDDIDPDHTLIARIVELLNRHGMVDRPSSEFKRAWMPSDIYSDKCPPDAAFKSWTGQARGWIDYHFGDPVDVETAVFSYDDLVHAFVGGAVRGELTERGRHVGRTATANPDPAIERACDALKDATLKFDEAAGRLRHFAGEPGEILARVERVKSRIIDFVNDEFDRMDDDSEIGSDTMLDFINAIAESDMVMSAKTEGGADLLGSTFTITPEYVVDITDAEVTNTGSLIVDSGDK